MRLLPRRLTLRTRLTILYSGLFFAAGVVLLGVTYGLFVSQLGPSLGTVMLRTDPSGLPSRSELPPPQDEPTRHTYIRTQDGDVLTGPEAMQWLQDQQDALQAAAAESLLVQGGIALLLVGGVASLLGWLVAGRVMAPLREVTATAHRISGAAATDMGLHARIRLEGPDDEVKELADAFDSMVERLDRSFAGQRRFVANASHELRTPLTLGRAMVEMAMHRPEASSDLRTLGADLLALNARHEALIGGLLDLAGAENGPLDRQHVDLADVVEHVADIVTAEAERAGVTVIAETVETITAGDAMLLERLVTNLVENGIRHNQRSGWVRVVTRRDDDQVILEVSNTGASVAAYDIPTLFQPFRRLGGDRLVVDRGNGLGLSIVDAVTRAHDGTVEAQPRAEGGLTVTVRLPAAR